MWFNIPGMICHRSERVSVDCTQNRQCWVQTNKNRNLKVTWCSRIYTLPFVEAVTHVHKAQPSSTVINENYKQTKTETWNISVMMYQLSFRPGSTVVLSLSLLQPDSLSLRIYDRQNRFLNPSYVKPLDEFKSIRVGHHTSENCLI